MIAYPPSILAASAAYLTSKLLDKSASFTELHYTSKDLHACTKDL